MTLVYLSLAWVAGIYLGSWISLPALAIGLGFLPLLALAFLLRRRAVILTAICLALLLSGTLRYQASLSLPVR